MLVGLVGTGLGKQSDLLSVYGLVTTVVGLLGVWKDKRRWVDLDLTYRLLRSMAFVVGFFLVSGQAKNGGQTWTW